MSKKQSELNTKPIERLVKEKYNGLSDWESRLRKLFGFVALNTQRSVATIELQNQLYEINNLIEAVDEMQHPPTN